MKSRYSKLNRIFIVIAMFIIAFASYVLIVNRNSVNMTGRQKFLKAIYPAFVFINKLAGKNITLLSNERAAPLVSFYSLKTVLNDGTAFDFALLKGKKVLLVNTASGCGYTQQYDQLQSLYKQYNDKLVVLGFPANDFKEQEKGTDEEIALFCKANFRVSFPLMKKSVVIKKREQDNIFKWLTDSSMNGWNNQAPSWNFSKYLVNEQGVLINYFGPAIEPLGEEIKKALDKN